MIDLYRSLVKGKGGRSFVFGRKRFRVGGGGGRLGGVTVIDCDLFKERDKEI